MLRDPLALTEKTILVPQALAPALALCDGSRDAGGIAAALAVRFRLNVSLDKLRGLINVLDEACLLENERSESARRDVLRAYRQAAFRPPSCVGGSYPEGEDDLRAMLEDYLAETNGGGQTCENVRGLSSPHIDFGRGGAVYAGVWQSAAEALRMADVVVIFGTDHNSVNSLFTLTRQNYATPLGVLRTDVDVVNELAEVVGEEAAFEEEIHHRMEHSVELAAVWMQYMCMKGKRDADLPALVPVLTGDLRAQSHNQDRLEGFISALRRATQGRRVFYAAAADLAHVGPAFGGAALDASAKIALQAADDELLRHICAGDAGGFYAAIQTVENCNNVCGVTPIYLTLRMIQPTRGRMTGYALCPADENNTSVVSVCGAVLE